MKITGNLNNNISNKLIVDSSTQNFVNSNNVDDMDRVSNQDILNDKVLGNLFGAIGGEIGRFPISFAIGAFLLAGLIGLGPLGSIISGLGLTALEIIPDLTYFGGGIIAKLNKKTSDNQKLEEDKFDKIIKNIGKISMGKIVGATLGATLGYSIGKILNLFNVDLPYPKRLVEETRDFKLTKIIGNASNITHTSRKKITSDELKEIMKNLKPGDIIINEIEDYTFINLVATLKTGKVMQWGHAMIYLGDGK
ncbi:MAG: hypothetical protein NZM44_06070, partial [Candidatus Calescibacterium sp.]|nr:hypothetical protein [Candidatus Calescibacterium sp.]